jgi:DNA-binding transcriptional ArsR family regulator
MRVDYELEERIRLTTPAQHKALGHPLRHTLLGLLGQRAASISQLADALGELKGTVSHHIRVLEAAGLIRVVRTRRVRGVVERSYGRVARRFELDDVEGGPERRPVLELAARELAETGPEQAAAAGTWYQRTRLSPAAAARLKARLAAFAGELAGELAAADTPGEPVWAVLLALHPTNLPSLPPRERDAG